MKIALPMQMIGGQWGGLENAFPWGGKACGNFARLMYGSRVCERIRSEIKKSGRTRGEAVSIFCALFSSLKATAPSGVSGAPEFMGCIRGGIGADKGLGNLRAQFRMGCIALALEDLGVNQWAEQHGFNHIEIEMR